MTDIIRIKAIEQGGEWALEVLGAPYGSPEKRDADGEYFTPRTEFYLGKAPLPPIAYYHGYTPDGKPQGDPEIIGQAVKVWTDTDGVWYRVVLDKASDYARRVWDAAQKGMARASSGVAGHLWRKTKSGEITHWLIGELSLFDAEGNRQPANQYAVARPAVKAALHDAGFNLDSLDGTMGDEQESALEPSDNERELSTKQESRVDENIINMSDVKQLITESLAAERQARENAEAAKAAEDARVAEAVNAARVKWETDSAAERRLPSGINAPVVAKFANLWKYDNLDAGDVAVLVGVLQADHRAVSEDALKALAIRATQEESAADMVRVKATMLALGMPIKANELNQSTLASYGDEWIGVAYSGQMWEKIRHEARIAAMLPTIEIPQGTESMVIPLESTPATFYKVAQASAQDTNTLGKATYTVTSSKMGTAQQTLTVGKLGARTLYTGELEEDSLVDWVSELRRKLQEEGAHILDSLVIDGDTETGATTNINDIAGTPAGTEYYLVANGFRKLALVTNTANSRAAGTLTVDDFQETLNLMGLAGQNALEMDKVAFLMDLWTYRKALALPEVRTKDVFSGATIENGKLTGLWGYPIMATPDMHRFNADTTYGKKANSAGKVDVDTAANNAYGALLAVRWDQWRLGWKRRMKIETQRIPQADATDVVLTMRVGLTYRDTEASAISYGVTV